MNQFGGNWTQQKIEIVFDYAKAYLTIMNSYKHYQCLYFDGFAGSGDIYKDNKTDLESIKGAAIRILEIDNPKSFDTYYFVELDENNKNDLEKSIKEKFPNKNTYVVCDDCNKKLKDLSEYLKKNSVVRTLAFIDPFGMALEWSSVEVLKGLGIDLWILVPIGIGVNRLLKKDGEISDAWLLKLETTLGLTREEIKNYFYKSKTINTLFGQVTEVKKEEDAIDKAGELYKERLGSIFKYVSKPLKLNNTTGSTMYHFMMATNNSAALKIANDVIKKHKN